MSVRIVAFDLYGTLLDFTKLHEVLAPYTQMPEAAVDAWRSRQLQLSNSATSTGATWISTASARCTARTVWVNRRRAGLLPRPEPTITDLRELPVVLDEYLAVG